MWLLWLTGLGIWLLFDDVFLSWGLLAPIKPELMNWPTIYQLMANRGLNPGLVVNGLHSIMAALSMVAVVGGCL